MTSKIKVDNINKVSDDSNIINKCGTTITLGASGDSINLAAGASQTGFGRTGTVNWVTTKKTTGFTAVSGEGYFCDTAASGAFTLTLPSSPSAGDIVGMKDYNGNFATANLTIGRNGQPINGGNAADVVINTNGASIFLVYVDGSQGWIATQDDSSTFAGVSFLEATVSGSCNTITTCGNCKVATFKNPGTFTVTQVSSTPAENEVSYMVVAGGGGSVTDRGGAGGAGGYRELKSPTTPYTASPLDGYPNAPNRVTVTATGYPIAVGGGGTGDNSPPYTVGGSGCNSSFSTIIAAGGGGGGRTPTSGADGGSGGGGSCSAGTGNTPPTTPAQGTNGGTGSPNSPPVGNGGGGGAGGAGGCGSGPGPAGLGGIGTGTGINPSPTVGDSGPSGSLRYFAGGGGGGLDAGAGAAGGYGGGGDGGGGPYPGSSIVNTNGADNTGGGAGGSNGGGPSGTAKNGGSGIVIIRYKFQ
jgi:hypothetical protein